jgi:starch synthase (maltosyl-transferring)
LLLAATTSPVYGIYSGYELCEGTAVRPGSEEYLDSEKYEIRVRDWNAAGNIKRDISRLNSIRSVEPALRILSNFQLCETESEHVLAFVKRDDASEQPHHLLCIVNLDPHAPHETTVHVPLGSLGLETDAEYGVKDLLTGTKYTWRGADNYVRLDPAEKVGHLFRIEYRA